MKIYILACFLLIAFGCAAFGQETRHAIPETKKQKSVDKEQHQLIKTAKG